MKPANLFLAEIGGNRTLKVLDFGIAKVLSTVSSITQALSETGASVKAFTPQYGAPEQFHRRFGATGPWTDVGTRKQFIDKVNATRKETHGSLARMPFENPALPQDFAEGFFYRDPPRAEEETIDEVKTSIEELSAELAERNALLAKLEEAAAVEAKAEADQKAEAQEIDALEAQAEKLLKQVAAKRAKSKK